MSSLASSSGRVMVLDQITEPFVLWRWEVRESKETILTLYPTRPRLCRSPSFTAFPPSPGYQPQFARSYNPGAFRGPTGQYPTGPGIMGQGFQEMGPNQQGDPRHGQEFRGPVGQGFQTMRPDGNGDFRPGRGGEQQGPPEDDTQIGPPGQPDFGRPTGPGPSASFTCPMHPEIRTHDAGSCPKCGMDLVPAK